MYVFPVRKLQKLERLIGKKTFTLTVCEQIDIFLKTYSHFLCFSSLNKLLKFSHHSFYFKESVFKSFTLTMRQTQCPPFFF